MIKMDKWSHLVQSKKYPDWYWIIKIFARVDNVNKV